MLTKLRGNDLLKADLSVALRTKTLPQSILLCGAPGLGKNFAARCIAADYLYPMGGAGAERVMNGICEECITLESEGAGGFIKVDAVRAARKKAAERAMLTDGRVILIKDAQRLHPNGANALLKIIEEPPEGVLFLLTTDSEASILLTIRSRCAIYTMSPIPVKEIAAELAKAGAALADAQLLCGIYGGQLGSCLKSSTKERLAQLADAVRFANAAAARDSYGMMKITAFLLNKKERESIGIFLHDSADVLASQLSGGQVPGVKADMAAAARCLDPIHEALGQLAANGNQKLLITLLCAKCAVQLS